MTTNTTFCNKISSFTDYKWRIQCKCKVKFTNQNCIGCCSTDLFPTSGVSYFLHEELRGKGVQNVTISSHNKVSYLAMASPFKSLMHYIFCLLCMVLYFFAFHISSFHISKINVSSIASSGLTDRIQILCESSHCRSNFINFILTMIWFRTFKKKFYQIL